MDKIQTYNKGFSDIMSASSKYRFYPSAFLFILLSTLERSVTFAKCVVTFNVVLRGSIGGDTTTYMLSSALAWVRSSLDSSTSLWSSAVSAACGRFSTFWCCQRRLPLDIADAWYRSAWRPVWYSTILAARLHLRDLKQNLRGIAILLLGFGYW
ncbi:hypothetical protein F444_18622 [Phytophthora nicotianae P1976]|uniref:Uncharacterized protein n=1 Tax=Phytophthora nicotianae P1976 TaxID=1317066 RepID=A0A080ZAS9_PHYNI|nr:hypothetical protein F444_18622 [Phytophthora nicotianae P1976]